MLLLLLACATDPKPVDTAPDDTAAPDTDTDTDTGPAPVDADDDGWTAADGDCDDADATRFPGRAEDCDGDDDNCNGLADEGFGDADDDDVPDCLDVEACDGIDNTGDGVVDEGSPDTDADGTADCMDTEACDGLDNNGDGLVDEGFDLDGDTFAGCFDCDDTDATVFPDAPEPNDGRDHDCDGLVDDGAWQAGDLAIVEVMVNPQDLSDPEGEWIEVVNLSDRPLNLDGVSIWSGADEGVLSGAGSIAPGERLVIGGSAQEWIDVVWRGVSLGNGADEVEIYAGTVRVDSLAWDGGRLFPDATAASLSLDPWYITADENDAADRWCASTIAWGRPGTQDLGSPGAPNEPCTTIDHDFDGVSPDDGDCDDANPDVFAGAVDTWYDGIDTDCDAWSDYDADRDGFDAVAYAGADCDDAAAGTNPGEDEICDAANTDEDCDGAADDLDSAPTDPATWYQDTDGDGYGDEAATATWCDAPAGWSTSDEDCDDTTADVSPGATETCGNGVDDDCDGTTNGCGPGGEQDLDANAMLLGESASGEAGLGLDFAGDVDSDGIVDVLVGASGDTRGGRGAGAAYLVLGDITDDVSLADADLIVTGESGADAAGAEVDGVGDIDDDGIPDFVVGATGNDAGATEAGAVYILSGAERGVLSLASVGVKLTGEARGDEAGAETLGLGDGDGDGRADVAFGVGDADAGGVDAGVVYLFNGGFSVSASLGTADGELIGEDRGDEAGTLLALAGDLDGDGISDLLVGSPYDDDGGTDAGAVYVVYLPVSGTLDLSAADAKITGPRASSGLYTAAGPGDLDGDGLDDVAVGAPGVAARRGAAYVFLTSPVGSVSANDADLDITGDALTDGAGAGLGAAGDLDGDGQRALLIGVTGVDTTTARDAGAVYLWSDFSPGSYDIGDSTDVFVGTGMSDQVGVIVLGGVDKNGDGFDDALVGNRSDDTAASAAGAAYLLYGGLGQ
jgi:hypothetical protein